MRPQDSATRQGRSMRLAPMKIANAVAFTAISRATKALEVESGGGANAADRRLQLDPPPRAPPPLPPTLIRPPASLA